MQKNVTKAKGALGKQGFYKLPDRMPGIRPTDDRIVEALATLYSVIMEDKTYGVLSIYMKQGFISVDSQIRGGEDRLSAVYISPEMIDWPDWEIDPEEVTEVEG